MIQDPRGAIDYAEQGRGPTTLVLVPGSWSTGAAWKSVIASFVGDHRIVTTSLLGYGGTAERRTDRDTSLDREAEVVERVVERAGGPVHLVGHSFGGLTCIAVARRGNVDLSSLTMLESTSFDALRQAAEDDLYDEVRTMAAEYAAAFRAGDREAARSVLDFYGGPGSFDGFPPRMREYIVETTHSNVIDWASAFGSHMTMAELATLTAPTLVVRGSNAHRCVGRAAEIVASAVARGELATIPDASHFMMSTHPREVAALIEAHVGNSIGS